MSAEESLKIVDRSPTSHLLSLPRTSRITRLRNAFFHPSSLLSASIFLIFVISALLCPIIAPYSANEPTDNYFAAPSKSFPFGTDNLGRDILSRTMYGARTSLQVGFLSVALGTILGAMFGLVTGYFGGGVDFLGQRLIDVLMSLPGLLLALLIAASLGPSLINSSLAIALAILPSSTRVARGSTMTLRAMPFIEAAHTLGAGHVRVLGRHILPNILGPLIVIASVQLGFAIIAEASLSYLGLGVPVGVPSWGNMLSGSSILYMQKAPWLALAPGGCLALVVVATNLLGDTIRDWLDPRMRL